VEQKSRQRTHKDHNINCHGEKHNHPAPVYNVEQSEDDKNSVKQSVAKKQQK
jgi:hypothetical protein